MRCRDCNKFVSLDCDDEPEVEVSSSGAEISADIRIHNNCAECGTELTEATFQLSERVDHEDCEAELSIEVMSANRTDRMNDVDRRGRKIKNSRYMRHMYGAEVVIEVTCESCLLSERIEWSDEIAGSAMDEL